MPMSENETKNPDNSIPENGKTPDTPRRWHASNLGAVRRRLVAAIQEYEADPVKLNRERIASFKALVYAYGTLAGIVRDSTLDDVEKRLDAIEAARNATP